MALNSDYQTLRSIVLNKIREMILDQTLQPGSRISLEELCTALGVSRMPVREALNALSAEGLVQSVPHRGVFVSDIGIEDIEELTLIRCALEGIAANYGAKRITEERLASMKELLDAMALDSADPHNLHEHYVRHKSFHFTLYEASGLQRLCRVISPLWEASERYRRAGAALPGRRGEAWREHKRVYDACAARDGDLAQELVVEHLKNTSAMYIEALKKADAEPGEVTS